MNVAGSMNVRVDCESLMRALRWAHAVVPRAGRQLVLQHALLQAGAGLTVTATSRDVGLRLQVPGATVEEPGQAMLPIKEALAVVRGLSKGSMIQLTGREGSVELNAGAAQYHLPSLPAEEFPEWPEPKAEPMVLSAQAVAEAVRKTLPAASTDETRYNLNGALLHVVGSHLRLVATDGHRLAMMDWPVEEGAARVLGELRVILPREGLAQVDKLIGKATQVVARVTPESVVWETPEVALAMRPLGGEFPDYRQVIRPEVTAHLHLDRSTFAAALTRVAKLDKHVRLSISAGAVVVSGGSDAAVTEELAARFDGDGLVIGFDTRYLLDVLAGLEGEAVEIGMSDEMSPILVQEGSYLALVMPYRWGD